MVHPILLKSLKYRNVETNNKLIMNEVINEFVMTRGAILKRDSEKDFIAVSYTARKKKPKSSEVNSNAAGKNGIGLGAKDSLSNLREILPRDSKKEQEIQMKTARYDVIKFGSSGFDAAKKEEAKIVLAVKLGAKPPKNKGKNYKELRLERQKAKEQMQKQESMSSVGKNLAKPRIDKKRRKQPHLLSSYGVVKNISNSKNKER